MDGNTFVWKGPAAEIRWAYHTAARLGPWTITTDATGATFTAQVIAADAFKVSQQPLTFVVERQKANWSWPIESLQLTDTSVTGRVKTED